MNKYNKLIYSIETINNDLIKIYNNIKIGYVLYKDYSSKIENRLKLNQSHIKIIKNSSKPINIQEIENFKFEGGDDYAEDWANPLYEISKLKLNATENIAENIVIHICDSGAHGNRFSEYCNKNEQEALLIEALKECKKNKIKIIGIILNNYSKKSFIECQKIYKEIEGYYNIIDIMDNNNIDEEKFTNLIKENIENALNNKENKSEINNSENDNLLKNINEDDFNFKEKIVKMRKLSQIEKYKGKKFTFLPEIIDENQTQVIKGIEQGAIGDCYLISSILSMVTKFPLIFKYIFPHLDYNEESDIIKMYIYENGIKKLISFKNTYATKDEKNLLFAKPYNNELYGIILEKGYAVSKISKIDKSIQTGYNSIVGGSGYKVFQTILGSSSEKYQSNSFNYYSYKTIDKNLLKQKIKKYIDYGGIITFGVYYIKGSGHEYSLQGYKIYKNEMFLEILNPPRSGSYLEENIYVEEDYNKKTQEDKDEFDKSNMPKIYENEFTTEESIKSLKSYSETGFLIINYEIFLKWFGTIDICDPMFGSNEQTIIFMPDGSSEYSIKININNKTKFKASLTREKENSKYEYKLELNLKNKVIKDEVNTDLIYEILESGNYIMKIISNSEINNIVNLKIQCYSEIDINVNMENNNVIIFENKKIFSDVHDEIDNMNNFMKKFSIFSNSNNLNFFPKPLNKDNIYYRETEHIEENNKISFPNLYFDYQNTQSGYCLNVINKNNFDIKNGNNIKIVKSGNECEGITKHGKFKITKDLKIKDFDKEFKEYLVSKGINGDEIDLNEFEIIDKSDIESHKSKPCCC